MLINGEWGGNSVLQAPVPITSQISFITLLKNFKNMKIIWSIQCTSLI